MQTVPGSFAAQNAAEFPDPPPISAEQFNTEIARVLAKGPHGQDPSEALQLLDQFTSRAAEDRE
jgi:hypothetical protein